MTTVAADPSDAISALNDDLRCRHIGGAIVVTHGLRALGDAAVASALDAVACFDAFTLGNDPYGERDFGVIEVQGRTAFFKIDSYDCELRYRSPDPADPAVTRRVMTLMLADEY